MPMPKILVVEDELIIASRIAKTLVSLGYEVPEPVPDARQAMEAIRTHQPDLVLLDINLAGDEDGICAAQKINLKYGLPIVFLTALSDKGTIERAKPMEPAGYLVKPFSKETLHATIETALFNHQKKQFHAHEQQTISKTIASLDDCILTTDTEYRITFMNSKAMAVCGTQELATSKGMFLDDLVQFSSANRRIHWQAILNEKASYSGDAEVLFVKCNKRKSVFVQVQPILHNNTVTHYSFHIRESMQLSNRALETLSENVQHIFCKKGKQHVRVDIQDIMCIESLDNYVILYTAKDRYIVHATLKSMENLFCGSDFIKVHRSYLVRFDKIEAYKDGFVVVGGKEIAIGRTYREAVMERLTFL